MLELVPVLLALVWAGPPAINDTLLPYGINNQNCHEESCIIRNLPPIDKSALVDFVQKNPQLWNNNSVHTLDKTKNRGQIWLKLTNNAGDKQYEFPMWKELKDRIMPLLVPYVTQECQLLRVSFSFIDPARHPRFIVPHSDTGKWALYSHRIHHPLSGRPTIFYWSTQQVGNHSVEVHDLNRYEWNNIQRHSVTYLGEDIRVHLISDTLDECPVPALIPTVISQPNLCKYVSGDLSCRAEGEAADDEPELAYGEDVVENPITGRKQKRKGKRGSKKGGKKAEREKKAANEERPERAERGERVGGKKGGRKGKRAGKDESEQPAAKPDL